MTVDRSVDTIDVYRPPRQRLENISYRDRHHLTALSRAVSAFYNPDEDEGILVGNWDGKNSGGSSPLSQNGSE